MKSEIINGYVCRADTRNKANQTLLNGGDGRALTPLDNDID